MGNFTGLFNDVLHQMLFALAAEWELVEEHREEDDSSGPDVHGSARLQVLSGEDLRGHVAYSSEVSNLPLVVIVVPCDSEIHHLDFELADVREKYVFELEVSMDDAFLVAVVHCVQYLLDEDSGFCINTVNKTKLWNNLRVSIRISNRKDE